MAALGNKSEDQVKNTLQALYAQWFAAIPDDEDGLFERILSDDWVYTNFLGEVRGKSDYKEYIKAVDPQLAPRGLSELQVRIFGDLVIAHGRYAAPSGLDEADRQVRFTAVWIERAGTWQSLAHHATLVAPPA